MKQSVEKMKVFVLLVLVAVAAAFDFPEDWELWKNVSRLAVCVYSLWTVYFRCVKCNVFSQQITH